MRFFRSSHGPWSPPAGDARRTLAFHRSIPGYEATPLIDVDAFALRLGVGRVVVKDETSRLGLPAFKMLGASWATHRLLCDRLGLDPGTVSFDQLLVAVAGLSDLVLVAATDGNHGRAVARMARVLGVGAEIYVPEGTARARIDSIEDEGATVTEVDGTYDEAVRRSATRSDEHHLVVSDTSWPGYEDVPRWVIEGYATIFAEVDDQLGGASPDAVVIQMGVGALASATAAHYRQVDRPSDLWLLGVEPESADCVLASVRAGEVTEVPGPHRSIMAGLNCGLPSLVAFPVVAATFDAFVAIGDEDAKAAMRAFADIGIVAGETGAAGLAGVEAVMHDEAARQATPLGPDSTVLLICTEGATDPVAYEQIVGRPVDGSRTTT
jgi:diaminopropionate ammonia-lyase